jgi:hypothetical protein
VFYSEKLQVSISPSAAESRKRYRVEQQGIAETKISALFPHWAFVHPCCIIAFVVRQCSPHVTEQEDFPQGREKLCELRGSCTVLWESEGATPSLRLIGGNFDRRHR